MKIAKGQAVVMKISGEKRRGAEGMVEGFPKLDSADVRIPFRWAKMICALLILWALVVAMGFECVASLARRAGNLENENEALRAYILNELIRQQEGKTLSA